MAAAAGPPLVAGGAYTNTFCVSTPSRPRAFSCRCGRPVSVGNSRCLACSTPLGYDAAGQALLPLEPATDGSPQQPRSTAGPWRRADSGAEAQRFWRCSNLDSAAACNWLVAEPDAGLAVAPLCCCCRLTRTLPDLSLPENPLWWHRIEEAKRRLVSSLIGLKLPVKSKIDDPAQGGLFDLLRTAPGQTPVVTGHAGGVITIDVQEADNAWREQRRTELIEFYRTLLAHLRHESGHFYWQRLVAPAPWLAPFRALFGDERQGYTRSLQRHYAQVVRVEWGGHHVSAFASSHP